MVHAAGRARTLNIIWPSSYASFILSSLTSKLLQVLVSVASASVGYRDAWWFTIRPWTWCIIQERNVAGCAERLLPPGIVLPAHLRLRCSSVLPHFEYWKLFCRYAMAWTCNIPPLWRPLKVNISPRTYESFRNHTVSGMAKGMAVTLDVRKPSCLISRKLCLSSLDGVWE